MPAVQSMPAGQNNAFASRGVSDGESGGALRDLSSREIEGLVESLNSLHEGELGIDMLVACGARAIEPLRRFLLHGTPSGIFLPRQRAVRALAQLGAKDVLLEYLGSEQDIRDPVAAHGEEAVKNTAARALSAWRTDDVYHALRLALWKRKLTGVIEALGEFKRAEAVPELIAALEDDYCRTAAEDALRKIGETAHALLIEAARTPDPSGVGERPTSQRRRRSALRLLETLLLSAEDWNRVAALVHDNDPEIVARASQIGLAVGSDRDRELAAKRLIEVLPKADWLLQGEIEMWIEAHLDLAMPMIDAEIRRRQQVGGPEAHDNVLRLLLSLREKSKVQS